MPKGEVVLSCCGKYESECRCERPTKGVNMNNIARIKFLVQKYADFQDDLDKTAATIMEVAQPPACLATKRQITCRELSCVDCPVRLNALDLVEKALRICPKCGADRENYQEEMHAPCCQG